MAAQSTYGGEIVPDCEPRPPESEWVISIKEKLKQGGQDNVPVSEAKLSIYRFPSYLKYGEEKDWVPQIVSLGPYHHGKEGLRHMERHKWRCLHRVLERYHQEIIRYLDLVKEVEGRARACYEEAISMSSDAFVEMMVLDGCFVIELFWGFEKGFMELGYPHDDPVFSVRPSMLEIQQDAMMLENQIPLFILDRLLGLQLGDPNQKGGVAKLAIQFFAPLMLNYNLEFNPTSNHGGVHILEVYWRRLPSLEGSISPGSGPTRWSKGRKRLTPFLTELREAGIKIKCDPGRSWGDIEFEDRSGILRIPPLKIHEGTRSLYLNLIALEQSHWDCNKYVTSYVIFMSDLISSPEDVRYLCDREIIVHCFRSHAEVVDLFNRLCQGLPFWDGESYLRVLSEDLKGYRDFGPSPSASWFSHSCTCWMIVIYKLCVWYLGAPNLARKWRAWRAILKDKYFDNPWSIISLIAAFVLLVLTFIQALYSVYGYYRPRS